MTMTQRYAGMLRRHADEWDKGAISPVKGEAIRQAAGHMEELQAEADAAQQALGLLAGLHPCLTVEHDRPMEAAETIFASVQAEIKQWRDEAERSRAELVALAGERAKIARAKLAAA